MFSRWPRDDTETIFSWLQQRSPQGATTWYEALREAVKSVAARPEIYPAFPEAMPRWNRQIHQALFKTPRGRRYRIVFEWTDTEIRILRVRGPGQRPLRSQDLPE
jgi:plasmid stabilization system protein ParE